MASEKPTITYDDFTKLDLRVAKVLEAEDHPHADKLLCLKIDVGGSERQIIAGLRGHYQPQELVGKEIVVLVNLQPRKMRGLESQGMLLAAGGQDDGSRTLAVLTTDKPTGAGAEVS